MNRASKLNSKESEDTEIAISVLIPVWNETKRLKTCLSALLSQNQDSPPYEVLVLEGRGGNSIVAVADPRIQLHQHTGRSAASGLNEGLRRARGSIIIRVDARTQVAPDYLERVWRFFASEFEDSEKHPTERILVCFGGTQCPTGRGKVGQAIALLSRDKFGNGGAAYRQPSNRGVHAVDTVYLGAWPRALFETLGGFDEALDRNQDDEFCFRIRAHGGRVALDPELQSSYEARETLRGVAQQYFAFGRWKPRVLWRYPGEIRLRHLVPTILAMGTVILGLASSFSAAAGYATLLWLGLWLGANLSVLWRQRSAAAMGMVIGPTLIATAAAQQFSYGFGFCWGLLRGPWRPAPNIPSLFAGSGEQSMRFLFSARDRREDSKTATPLRRLRESDARRKVLATLFDDLGLHASALGRGLEIGIGKGDFARDLLSLGCSASSYFGVDLSTSRLDSTRAQTSLPHLATASGRALPFADSAFEFAVFATVLSSVLDPRIRDELLTEATRVVAPGGIILIYDLRLAVPGRPWNPVGKAEFEAKWGPAIGERRVGFPIATVAQGSSALARIASCLLETSSWGGTHHLLMFQNQKPKVALIDHA